MSDRFDEVADFRASLDPETDRGCVLMAASFLDSELELLLGNFVVNDSKVIEETFSQGKAVGTFSSRIDLAYLLGLIGKSARRDLHLIRKIRNAFGHTYRPLSFADQDISNRCRELTYTLRPDTDPPRKHFVSAAVGALAIIHSAMHKRERITLRADPDLDAAKARAANIISRIKDALDDSSNSDSRID
ncbi:hypothetical protein D3C71_1337810 [compost metagenome]